MKLDIYQLDNIGEYNEEAAGKYVDAVVDGFESSPEFKELKNMCGWIGQFIRLGYDYEGVTPSSMTLADLDEIVTNLFPRKVSTDSDGIAGIIPELIAFWHYLAREFQLPLADDAIRFLQEIEPQFHDIMTDPSNFGMAKSIMMGGSELGFDMTTQEGIDQYMLYHNSRIVAANEPPSFQQHLKQIKPATSKNKRKRMRKRRGK